MESIRVTAKTVQEAITEALIQLGTSSDNMEYTVIDEGSKGFFGIGGRKAVIEAKKKFTDEDLMKEVFGTADEKKEKPKKEFKKEPKKELKKEPKKEVKKELKKEQPAALEEKKDAPKEKSVENPRESRKENRRESGRESSKAAEQASERGTARKESAAAKREAEGSAVSGAAAVGRKKNFAEAAGEKAGAAGELRSENTRTYDREAGDEGRGYRRSGRKDFRRQAPEEEAAATVPEQTEEAVREPRVPADPEEAKRRAEKFLRDVFGSMEMGVEIRMEFEDDTLSVELTGEDMGLLIGKRGQTLDSLQYLTSLVVNKGKAAYVRVKLDTEDYRSRRKATLENLAKNIAMKVKKTRRPVFLEPMNPYERRIIHSALQNDPYVTTHSEGDEPNRKVVVTPRKRNDGRPSGRDYRERSYRERSYGARSYAEKRETEVKEAEVKEAEVREAAAVPAETEDKD